MSFLFLFVIILGFVQHFPSLASSIGFGSLIGSVMLSMSMLGNVISKLFSGLIADIWGAIKATLIMVVINLISLLTIFSVKSYILLEISSLMYGMMYSIITVCLTLLSKEFYSDHEYNHYFPIISLVGGISNALSTSVLGYVYDFSSSYYTVFFLLLALHIAGLLMILHMHYQKKKIH